MHHRTILTCVLVLFPCAISASAANVTTLGAISLVAPPPDVRLNALRDDTTIWAFAEQQNVLLAAPLTFSITQPGTSPSGGNINNSPGDVSAGTRVNSYYLHYESVTGTGNHNVLTSGSITFDTDILGIAIYNARLNQSDAALALGTTLYPHNQERELDIADNSIYGQDGNDRITLSADRRTVFLEIGNTGGLDQVRIVTAVPEPSAFWLALSSAMSVTAWRIRRAVRRRSPR